MHGLAGAALILAAACPIAEAKEDAIDGAEQASPAAPGQPRAGAVSTEVRRRLQTPEGGGPFVCYGSKDVFVFHRVLLAPRVRRD